MNRKVPAFATWLLERFGVKRQNEALMGDLAEEYQAGKSPMWYWWQTLVAIWVTAVRDVREHKLLALRAVAMTWILCRLFAWLRQGMLLPLIAPYYNHSSLSLQMVWAQAVRVEMSLQWLLIGWLVARVHRAHAGAMVLVAATWRVLLSVWFLVFYEIILFKQLVTIPTYLWVAVPALSVDLLMLIAGGLLVRPKTGSEQPPATIAHPAS